MCVSCCLSQTLFLKHIQRESGKDTCSVVSGAGCAFVRAGVRLSCGHKTFVCVCVCVYVCERMCVCKYAGACICVCIYTSACKQSILITCYCGDDNLHSECRHLPLRHHGLSPLYPPDPVNYVKIFKGWPLQDALSKLVQLFYKSCSNFNKADFCLDSMKKPTILSNKCNTV